MILLEQRLQSRNLRHQPLIHPRSRLVRRPEVLDPQPRPPRVAFKHVPPNHRYIRRHIRQRKRGVDAIRPFPGRRLVHIIQEQIPV